MPRRSTSIASRQSGNSQQQRDLLEHVTGGDEGGNVRNDRGAVPFRRIPIEALMLELTPAQWKVLSFLLMAAAHTDRIVTTATADESEPAKVGLRRGQVLIGARPIAERIGMTRETVRSALKSLERLGHVEISHPRVTPTPLTHPGSVITVCNYNGLTSMNDEATPTPLTQGSHPQLKNKASDPYGSASAKRPKKSKNSPAWQQRLIGELCDLAPGRIQPGVAAHWLSILREVMGTRAIVAEAGGIVRRYASKDQEYWTACITSRARELAAEVDAKTGAPSERTPQLPPENAELLRDLGGGR